MPDDPDALRDWIDAREPCDLVVFAGGVSVGAHDVVRHVLGELGTVGFARVAMQPASRRRSVRAGRHARVRPVGNPVSVAVSFEAFAAGAAADARARRGPSRRRGSRSSTTDGSPPPRAASTCRSRSGSATGGLSSAGDVGGAGSHLVAGLAAADGFAIVPEDVEARRRGRPRRGGDHAMSGLGLDAVILAGGRRAAGRREQARPRRRRPKPARDGDRRAGSARLRPDRRGRPARARGRRMPVVREDPPFGGPVAALAAGSRRPRHPGGRAAEGPPVPRWSRSTRRASTEADVLVLACDMPDAEAAVARLVAGRATARPADGSASSTRPAARSGSQRCTRGARSRARSRRWWSATATGRARRRDAPARGIPRPGRRRRRRNDARHRHVARPRRGAPHGQEARHDRIAAPRGPRRGSPTRRARRRRPRRGPIGPRARRAAAASGRAPAAP